MNIEEKFKEIMERQSVTIKTEDPTVFDISGYPHYENVISNWYAFFLDDKKPHGFEDLFYKSLRQLVGGIVSGKNCTIEREYPAAGGRIDLLVYEEENAKKFYNPIIIENKIYADLYNKLDDYWESIIVDTDSVKIGLVLCLHKRDRKNNNGFLVKTHQEYIDLIKLNLPNYLLKADLKYINLLQDFMVNIERMTNMSVMNENSRYYFNHAKKIDELMLIKNEANLTVINNVYDSIKNQGSWSWGRSKSSEGYFDLSVDDTGARLYVTLRGLNYDVLIWMNKDLLEKWENIGGPIKKQIRKMFDREGIIVEKFNENDTLVLIKYVINEDKVDNYHNEIIDSISKDMVSALKIVESNVT